MRQVAQTGGLDVHRQSELSPPRLHKQTCMSIASVFRHFLQCHHLNMCEGSWVIGLLALAASLIKD